MDTSITKIQVRFLILQQTQVGEAVYVPWALYRLPIDKLIEIGLRYEEVPQNKGKRRVGTRLAWLVEKTRIGTKSCSQCALMKELLDAADSSWIKKTALEIVEQIQENAKNLGFDVSRWKIKLALRLAIWIEGWR